MNNMSGRAYSSVHFKTLADGVSLNLDSFRSKKARDWDVDDLVGWMIHVARKYGIPLEEMDMHRFSGCTGDFLTKQTEKNFIERNPKFGGLLFKEFLALSANDSSARLSAIGSKLARKASHQDACTSLKKNGDDEQKDSKNACELSPFKKSTTAMTASSSSSVIDAGGRQRAGRACHKSGNKLWEFIRNALHDPDTCPSIIRWENRDEGIFRIVESEKMARLWGMKKNNSRMTYEKLSRAMRYYYNSKIILPVTGRRLVYRFGPNATNWNACS